MKELELTGREGVFYPVRRNEQSRAELYLKAECP